MTHGARRPFSWRCSSTQGLGKFQSVLREGEEQPSVAGCDPVRHCFRRSCRHRGQAADLGWAEHPSHRVDDSGEQLALFSGGRSYSVRAAGESEEPAGQPLRDDIVSRFRRVPQQHPSQ